MLIRKNANNKPKDFDLYLVNDSRYLALKQTVMSVVTLHMVFYSSPHGNKLVSIIFILPK